MLRTEKEAKISWDEVGWGLVTESTKMRERLFGFEFS